MIASDGTFPFFRASMAFLRFSTRWIVLLLGLSSFVVPAFGSSDPPGNDWHLAVGILEDSGVHFQREANRHLVELLNSVARQNQTSLEIRNLKAQEIQKGVKSGQIDIFFADSLTYRSLVPYGVKDIAGIQSQWNPNPNHADGGVAIALRSNGKDPVFESYKGSRAISSSDLKTQALYYVLGAIQTKGHDPESFFSLIDLSASDQQEIVKSILNGKADVGIVSACFMEEFFALHPQDIARIDVLDAYRSPEFPCTVSTSLYPGWVVGLTSRVPLSFARELTRTLLQTSPSSEFWWTIPTQYDVADELLRTLKVENYAYLREWTVEAFLSRYGLFVGIFITAFFAILCYSWTVSRVARRLNRQLVGALSQKKRYQTKLTQAESQLSFLERVGVLTQVSAVLAHELRQPIGAIVMFAHGLMRRLENGTADSKEVLEVTDKIAKSAALSNEIITNVRNFAKSGSKKSLLNLSIIARQACDNFLVGQRGDIVITLDAAPNARIAADAFELELMLINLIRNSAEAICGTANPRIYIRIGITDKSVVLVVTDSGSGSSLPFKHFFHSNKSTGMGLGLKLVKEIVQNNDGAVEFSQSGSGALIVTIRFPLAESDGENECTKR